MIPILRNGSVTTNDKTSSNIITAQDSISQQHSSPILKTRLAKHTACHEMAKANSAGEFGSALNELIASYYSDVLNQARVSFNCAVVASIVAAGFFLGAVGWTMQSSGKQQNPQTAPSLSLIAGVLVEVIAGINFYLYARTSRQLASYHICLERTNRFLLANSLCCDLSEDLKKDAVREQLIETMMNAPMLTISQATGTTDKPSKKELYIKELIVHF